MCSPDLTFARSNSSCGALDMADTRTPEQRRYIMQSVGTKNTGPELALRRLLFGLGYRYRLHSKKLPGSPDIVFPGKKKAIFVHGCFWHGHGCPKGQAPKSHRNYWQLKLSGNQERDRKKRQQLEALGWSVLIVWQCELKDSESLKQKVVLFLN
jgi:DNA mismatch endonuclease (patch repair protein)